MTQKIKKVHTIFYGCQMSERDAATLTAISGKTGYVPADNIDEADLVIVNTCCVRESAENKIIGKIGQLKKYKERKPSLKIAVTGCMVQQPGLADRLRKKNPHVDIWTGTSDLDGFQKMLELCERGEKIVRVSEDYIGPGEAKPLAEKGKLRVSTNIIYGCNNYCAYCIVPYVRGKERSRPLDMITAEIKELAASGTREVTLLGQNVNSYGIKDGFPYDFADLLAAVDRIDNLLRIRFTTSHPKDLSAKLITTVSQGKHICEHFHLPFQAGSNKVLKAMNRQYTREYYLDRVNSILKEIPEARLSTDIIVGFPGETEEDFKQTLDLVNEVHFSQAFTFMYSRRSGTAAAELPEQIPLNIKKKRLQKLIEVQNTRSLAWRQEMIGKTYEILVEGPSKTDIRQMTGRTRGNEIVIFEGKEGLTGSLVNVKINSANSWTLFGQILP